MSPAIRLMYASQRLVLHQVLSDIWIQSCAYHTFGAASLHGVSCDGTRTILLGADAWNGCVDRAKVVYRYLCLDWLPILLDIICLLINSSFDCIFWTACLIAFFGMLRILIIFPKSSKCIPSTSDVAIHQWSVAITFHYTKAIQFKAHSQFIALLCSSNVKLCFACALGRALLKSNCLHTSPPMFCYNHGGLTKIITYSSFTSNLKGLLAILWLT